MIKLILKDMKKFGFLIISFLLTSVCVLGQTKPNPNALVLMSKSKGKRSKFITVIQMTSTVFLN